MIDVATADTVACALTTGGGVWCWGIDELGTMVGAPGPRREPAQVSGTHGAVEVVVGNHHGCARMEDGEVRCWGWGGLGQLGDGYDPMVPLPVEVVTAERHAP